MKKFLPEVQVQLFGACAERELNLVPIGGGCIHQAAWFTYQKEKYFLKWSQSSSAMLELEAKGLSLLRNSNSIHVPKVIGQGCAQGLDYLCLAYIENSAQDQIYWTSFGMQLAELHQSSSQTYGLDEDNYIGSLPQLNKPEGHWVDFFINQRLNPQIRLAMDSGLIENRLVDQFESLFSKLGLLLPEEKPALLHGDLWSGNCLSGPNCEPYIFDPAVYYGHREAEIAFSKLFGGFDSVFYEAYNEVYPLIKDHEQRVEIFNLYPLLVHVNLFGSSYLTGIKRTLSQLA